MTPKKPKPETPHQRFERAMGVILSIPKPRVKQAKGKAKGEPEKRRKG